MGLERLLEETPEAYYWMGLIMADGYTSVKPGDICLIIALAEKDKEYLQKFSHFVEVPLKQKTSTWIRDGVKKTSQNYRLEKWDKPSVLALTKKFDLHEIKTYNPSNNLIIDDDDLFVSFMLGFIDGDGCIDKQGCLHVQCHSTWRNCLESWFNRLYKIISPAINTKSQKTKVKCNVDKRDGSVRVEIYNNEILMFMKNKTVELRLPVLARKWDRIIKRKSYARNSFDLKKKIRDGLKTKTPKLIAEELGVNDSYVSYIKNREKR